MRWLTAVVVLLVALAVPASRAADSSDATSILAVIPVGRGPTAGLAADSTAVWIPSDLDGTLSRVDPLTNQVSADIAVGPTRSCVFCLGGVALHDGAVWATSSSARLAIVTIDVATNQVAHTTPVSVFPSTVISAADGTLWLASLIDSAVLHVDPLSGRQLANITVSRPARLALGDDAVWATSRPDGLVGGSVVRINSATNRVVANIAVGDQPVAIAFGEGSVWVLDDGRQRLVRIDPRTNTVIASIPVGASPAGVVVGAGFVWVISQSSPNVNGPVLLAIDPLANAVNRSIPLGPGTPVGLAIGAGSLWVSSRDPDTVVRVDPSAPASSGGGDAALMVFCVLAAAGVVAGWGSRRRVSERRDPDDGQAGHQLRGLRRYLERETR